MRHLLVLMLLATIGQPPALAAAASQPEQPRFELGAAGAVFAVFDEVFSWGSRLSVNVTERAGIDVMGDVVILNEGSARHRGIYGIQYRQTIREGSPDRSAIFVTGGIAGVFDYERVRERREQRSDGSVVVYRGYSRTEMNSPAAFSVGVGMQRVFARYVALRAETQMIVGARIGYGVIRGALGISVPIGGHYAAHPQ